MTITTDTTAAAPLAWQMLGNQLSTDLAVAAGELTSWLDDIGTLTGSSTAPVIEAVSRLTRVATLAILVEEQRPVPELHDLAERALLNESESFDGARDRPESLRRVRGLARLLDEIEAQAVAEQIAEAR